MTVDELFLFTLDDLEARLDLARGEYDMLMAAALLRKLLFGGRRSLLDQVTTPRAMRIVFRVNPVKPEPSIQLWTPDSLYPEESASVAELSDQDFLKWPAVVVLDDGRCPLTLSVRDLIDYLANYQSAVHPSPVRERKHRALERFNRMRRFGPGWQCSGGTHACREVVRVVLAALEDLRRRVATETWPQGFPKELKGLEGQGVIYLEDGAIQAVTDGGKRVWATVPSP